LDRRVTHFLNRLLVCVLSVPLFGGVIHKLFARLLPIRRFTVRGVEIACVTPLHQTGTYLEAEAWSHREPDVLDWIDGFAPDSVFFDIGANFGTESLYAALKPGGPAQIHAFDAELIGSYNLALNLALNRADKVRNYVCAVGETEGLLQVAENLNYLWALGQKYAKSTKFLPTVSIDYFVAQTGASPSHIKIDVDGPEAKIVAGMRKTLLSPALKSLMIEINDRPSYDFILATLAAAGFREVGTPTTIAMNHFFERAPIV
jgi:FkbM family methyltransferase